MPRRRYASIDYYDRKLERVMERLGVSEWDAGHDRAGAWIQFRYRGQLYRFEQTLDRARERDQGLTYWTECYAQVVLALEDLARLVERGIYDLQRWIAGFKALPAPPQTPEFLRVLGFDRVPAFEEARARYRTLVKDLHPDRSSQPSAEGRERFEAVMRAWREAEAFYAQRGAESREA